MQSRNLATANGILVMDVFAGSPALAAGISAGDVILSIDGVPVRQTADIISYLGEFTSPGDRVTLGLVRGSLETTLPLELGTRQE